MRGDYCLHMVVGATLRIKSEPHELVCRIHSYDGGTKGKLWRQMIADTLGIALKTTESSDSSFGSAMLAGIAVGIFESAQDAVEKCVKPIDITYPNRDNTPKYREVFKVYKKFTMR